ncbi:MAG: AAA-like domain-containing protein [Spirulina sp.]
MAKESGYGEEYLKQIGAKLWGDISHSLDRTVTKKNLRLVLQEAFQSSPLLLSSNPLSGPGSSPMSSDPSYVFPSGPLPSDSSLYIHRPPAEATAFAEIDQPGCLLCIHAPHRYGKTSLLRQVMTYAKNQGYRACLLDLQEADSRLLRRADLLLPWLCRRMAERLGLSHGENMPWDPHQGIKVNCGLYLQRVVLEQTETPLVLAIHALEMGLGQASVAQDLLSMLRLWHEQAQGTPLWQRLRLVLVYASDSPTVFSTLNPHPLLSSVSPLNLGRSLRLPPLSPDQFLALGRRYQLDSFEDATQQSAIHDLYTLIAGHPYLAHLICYALQQGQQSLHDVLATATTPDSVFWHHLQERLTRLQYYPKAKSALRRVVLGNGVPVEGLTLEQLMSLGLVQVEDGLVHPLGEIYRHFFATYLTEDETAPIAS